MDAASTATTIAAAGPSQQPGRRSDAGTVRLAGRDVAGLLLCGDIYGAPYELLAGFLGVQRARLRAIVARGGTPGTPRPTGSAPAPRGAG